MVACIRFLKKSVGCDCMISENIHLCVCTPTGMFNIKNNEQLEHDIWPTNLLLFF
jgi:hypothetical protein